MVVFGTTYIAGCFDDVHPMMLSISPYQTMMVITSAMTCFCFFLSFFFFNFFSLMMMMMKTMMILSL